MYTRLYNIQEYGYSSLAPARACVCVSIYMSVSSSLFQNIIELAVPPPPIYIKAATMAVVVAVAYTYLCSDGRDAANGRWSAAG